MTTTVSASDSPAQLIISENGAPGDAGATGANGTGLNNIRKILIDNPLCHLFKTNNIAEVSAPLNTDADVSWSRATVKFDPDRYGVVQELAVDEAPWDYLAEISSTNILLYSNDFSNAAWVKIGDAIINSNTDIGPDGAMTASRFSTATGGLGNRIQQAISITDTGQDVATSFVVKKGTTDVVSLVSQYQGGTPISLEVILNLTTGVLSGAGSANASVEQLTDDWFRFDLYHTANSTNATIQPRLSVVSSGDIIVWHGQVEDNMRFSTSIMKTVAAPTIRSPDIVNAESNNNIPDVGGSWSVMININAPYPLTSNYKFFSIGAETVQLRVNAVGNIIYQDSSGTIDMGAFAINGSLYNACITYDGSTMSLYVDGDFKNSVTSPTSTFDSSDDLHLLMGSSGNQINGTASGLRFYDFELNQDEVTFLSGQ